MIFFFESREKSFKYSFIKVTSACVLTALKKDKEELDFKFRLRAVTSSTGLGIYSSRTTSKKKTLGTCEKNAGPACSVRPCGKLEEKNDLIHKNNLGWLK